MWRASSLTIFRVREEYSNESSVFVGAYMKAKRIKTKYIRLINFCLIFCALVM
jgi:hypothetical protein